MLERLPERVRSRRVFEAAMSPSGLLLAGAGASAAILAGAPIAAAAAVGGLAWLGRVALAIPRTPSDARIEPRKVAEPWRRFVVDAQEAKGRFDRTVRQSREGPLRDRLTSIGARIDDGVQECWRIARQGNVLQNALHSLEREAVERDLAEVADELRDASDARRATLAQTREALVAQLKAYERLEAVWLDARNRLQVLNAQLDEAVARAVELSVHTADAEALNPLSADVDTLVDDLEHLRVGLEEAGSAG